MLDLAQYNKSGTFTVPTDCTSNTKKSAKMNVCALLLVGVAAVFHAAFTSHVAHPSAASRLSEANHPVAVSPQWLPVLLAANTPGPPTNHRRLASISNVFGVKAELKMAVAEYDDNATAAEEKYGPVGGWDVSNITDMSELFKFADFNEGILGATVVPMGMGCIARPRRVALAAAARSRRVAPAALARPRRVALAAAARPRRVALAPAARPRRVAPAALAHPRRVALAALARCLAAALALGAGCLAAAVHRLG